MFQFENICCTLLRALWDLRLSRLRLFIDIGCSIGAQLEKRLKVICKCQKLNHTAFKNSDFAQLNS